MHSVVLLQGKSSKYLPHSAGRYSVKRFRKAQCPIVERLACSLMMHGRNNGKKLMTVRIVKHSFEIIHLLTGEVSLSLAYFFCQIVVMFKIIFLFGFYCQFFVFVFFLHLFLFH